jgi:ABC-type uncharacterized transport system permease subunit
VNPVLFLTQVLRISVPYLFAASGGVVAERAGIVSLTLEGFMLTGAFTATLGDYYWGNPWIGILVGIAGGLLMSLIHAVATIRYRADQVVVGIAIHLLAIGAFPGWTIRWCGSDCSRFLWCGSFFTRRNSGSGYELWANIPRPPPASAFPCSEFSILR